jgi:hypothetical protein
MNGVPGTCSISNGLIYEAIVHPQIASVCRRDLTHEVQRIFCKRLNRDLKVKNRYCSSIATDSLLII